MYSVRIHVHKAEFIPIDVSIPTANMKYCHNIYERPSFQSERLSDAERKSLTLQTVGRPAIRLGPDQPIADCEVRSSF